MSESMATGWYYLDKTTGADQQVGPLTWEQLYSVAAAGTLQAHDLVWHPALPQWTPAAQIQGLMPAPPAPSYGPPPAYAPAPTYAPAPGDAPMPGDAPAPAYAPAMPQGGERILEVVGGLVQSSGFMGVKQRAYSLILTDYRVIFAQLTKEKMTELIGQARDGAKSQGKGFFGQWGAQIGASGKYHQVYWQMSPEAVLAETPGNFAIDRATIKKVKFHSSTSGDDSSPTMDYVIIKTSAGKHKLRVNGSLSVVKRAFRDAGIG